MAMRFTALLMPFLLIAGSADDISRHPSIRFTPVMLDRDHPDRRAIGALTFLGGWALDSNIRSFGGISSIRVAKGRVLAISDAAQTFRFDFDGTQLQSPLTQSPVPGIFSPDNAKPDRDSEAMAHDEHTGLIWLSFERSNAIRRFSPDFGRKQAWVAPPAMAHWPNNAGAEAMVRLTDGRFLIFSEAARMGKGLFEAMLIPGDPVYNGNRAIRFAYRPPAGYQATDAAELPDGRLLVLNRHFSVLDGVAASLTIINPKAVAPGVILIGHEIARLAPPLAVDNFEGLSIELEKKGRIIIWLASDDNFNPLQRTLLMRFALDLQRVDKISRQPAS